MVNYWKSKVLPKIKKVFENPKKAAALEASKAFDESKVHFIITYLDMIYPLISHTYIYIYACLTEQEQYSKECEDKKTDLEPKVTEIYQASSTEIKVFIQITPIILQI